MRLLLAISLLSLLPLAAMGSETLDYLNGLRRHVGLQPLHTNTLLAKAAKAHARYSLHLQRYSHNERKGVRGYTGRRPSDRAVHAGYPSRFVMENIAVNTTDAKSTVDNLLSAIYHRFLFLGFDVDEMGEGSAATSKKRTIQQVHVFDMGAERMVSICRQHHKLYNGMYYFTDLCRERAKKIPKTVYEDARAALRKANSRIVLYPYPGQQEVPPAFYNETPDPMPGYKVSGFPVSVAFNPYYFRQTKIRSFRLYDPSGKMVRSRLLNHTTDPNGRLEPNEYALMPLVRLQYGSRYRVVLDAIVDGSRLHRSWTFTTRPAAARLYRIRGKREKIAVGDAKKIWLYFVPKHKKDILKRVRHTEGLGVKFVDLNTLEVTLPARRKAKSYRIVSSGREVKFE